MSDAISGYERNESWQAGWSAGRASREAELLLLRAQRAAALAICDEAQNDISASHYSSPSWVVRIRAALGLQGEDG